MALHDRTRRSRIYQEALKMAAEYLQNPDKLDNLVQRAGSKADKRRGALSEAWRQVQLLIAMLKSYRAGEYREVSNKSLMLIIAALLYFIIPADLIPDILLGLGYIDDIALLAWTVRTLSDELGRYEEWQKIQRSAMGPERARAVRQREGLLIEGELSQE